MDIASISPPLATSPDTQPQMYQFQSQMLERGNSDIASARSGNSRVSGDGDTGLDLKLTGTQERKVGDGLLRDFSRFASMMQSIEPRRAGLATGMRGQGPSGTGGGGRIGDGPSGPRSSADLAEAAIERGLSDMQRTAEYASYLGAMAVIVQNGVSGLKRLQQG
jgi:hypothetical protein